MFDPSHLVSLYKLKTITVTCRLSTYFEQIPKIRTQSAMRTQEVLVFNIHTLNLIEICYQPLKMIIRQISPNTKDKYSP